MLANIYLNHLCYEMSFNELTIGNQIKLSISGLIHQQLNLPIIQIFTSFPKTTINGN
jgi:hypothetical protein